MEDQLVPFRLPKRPKEGHPNTYIPFSLTTNHFQVDISKVFAKIFSWRLKLIPQVEHDNRQLRSELLKKVASEIEQKIGIFCDSGQEVYTPSNIENSNAYNFDVAHEQVHYTLTLSKTNELSTFDLKNQEIRVPIKFLNSLIKKSFKIMDYHQIGKYPKFFRMKKDFKKLENTNYIIYTGFQSTFNYYECGLMLRVDTAIKIINEKNVLQLIDQVYAHTNQQEEARGRIREMLIGNVVCANYGNYKTYKVLDILFDKQLSDITFASKQFNLIDYYQKKYQLKVSKEQPLLLSSVENKQKEKMEILLVPEFMRLTGLPNDINDYQKRQVLQACNKKPNDKMKSCIDFLGQLCQNAQQFNSLHIGINPKPYSFQGKKLKNPTIMFKESKLDENKISSFQMRNQKFVRTSDRPSDRLLNWLMIYQSQGFNKQQFEELFKSNVENYAFPVYPPVYEQIDGRYPSDQILKVLKNTDLSRFDLVVILVSKKHAKDYPKIKKECTINYRIPCQWILSENLEKNAGSIIGKVIQQIASKTGGYPWKVKPYDLIQPQQVQDIPLLLIGASVTRDQVSKKKTVAAIVSSLNNDVTQFYTQCIYQEDGSNLITQMTEIFVNCCKQYFQNTQKKPERIIYLRDGCSGSATKSFICTEMEAFLKAPSQLDQMYKPEIAICLVDRKPTQKFFVESNNAYKNPQFGTLIDSNIIEGKDKYEFKLIPQAVSDSLGCATPTSFTFVYDSTNLNQGQMQNLIYAQCFNYSNWNGSIRVPSVVQYAIKACELNSTALHCSINDSKLNKLLWYL